VNGLFPTKPKKGSFWGFVNDHCSAMVNSSIIRTHAVARSYAERLSEKGAEYQFSSITVLDQFMVRLDS
jgi:hypothetical protein